MKELDAASLELVVGGATDTEAAISGGLMGALGGAGAGVVVATVAATPLGLSVLAGAAVVGGISAAWSFATNEN